LLTDGINYMVSGYVIESKNLNNSADWLVVADIPLADNEKTASSFNQDITTYGYDGTKENPYGDKSHKFLRVLRDYKHYYRVRAYREFAELNEEGDEITKRVYSQAGVENWGARQITSEEFVRAATLGIGEGIQIGKKSSTGENWWAQNQAQSTTWWDRPIGDSKGKLYSRTPKNGSTARFIFGFKDYVKVWNRYEEKVSFFRIFGKIGTIEGIPVGYFTQMDRNGYILYTNKGGKYSNDGWYADSFQELNNYDYRCNIKTSGSTGTYSNNSLKISVDSTVPEIKSLYNDSFIFISGVSESTAGNITIIRNDKLQNFSIKTYTPLEFSGRTFEDAMKSQEWQ
ncbi:MAG: hypothetical protein ACRC4W_06505, partial [Treponemataceae bacterium]